MAKQVDVAVTPYNCIWVGFIPWCGLLIVEALRSHSGTPHSLGLLWRGDQTVAEICTWQQTSMPPTAGFEPVVPLSERPLTRTLDRAAARIGTGEVRGSRFAHDINNLDVCVCVCVFFLNYSALRWNVKKIRRLNRDHFQTLPNLSVTLSLATVQSPIIYSPE
jgi:hypothetical protein